MNSIKYSSKLLELQLAVDAITDSEYHLIKSDLVNSNNEVAAQKRSRFRGVSLNGKKFQTMVMGKSHKYFSPSLPCEKLAARVYDRYVI